MADLFDYALIASGGLSAWVLGFVLSHKILVIKKVMEQST